MRLCELFGKPRHFAASIRSADRAWCRAVAPIVAWLLNTGANAQTLEPLAIDSDSVTISGVSSGGFMALQFAVAHSAMVRAVCLCGHPDWHDFVGAVDSAILPGAIDPPSNLERMRGWVLAEGADAVVALAVVEAARDFLRRCRRGACSLHVALHGCRQAATESNQEFVRHVHPRA
jgi:poly(3-hydroxybutyrate) depolymerase